jgi:hypothetical protein
MTLAELLASGKKAYFYYDPQGLNKKRREISGKTGACFQNERPGKGWKTGGTVRNTTSVVLVDLAGRDGGPYLDMVRVI